MPPKRKAPAEPLPSEPSRRKLRSDGPITPAKPPPKSRATARTTRKTAAGPSNTENVPPKRATKKTTVHALPTEVDPATEVEITKAPKRRGRPPGPRLTVVEEEAIQAKPPSKKPPSTKPPSTKPPPRTSTRTVTRTTTTRAGSSKSIIKTSRPRTTKKNIPGVVEEEEPEEREKGEEPPTCPSHPRVPPPASPGKRRQNERSPSPESPRLPSPSKRAMRSGALTALGPTTTFPARYHACLQAQKRAIMAALRDPPEIDPEDDQDERPSANELAYSDLCDLLTGSVVRGEGNSCLLIGPRGSGKTRLVDRALAQASKGVCPIVIRLSGHIQQNDRLAIHEIAWQLSHQTGKQIAIDDEHDGGNPTVNEDEIGQQDVASLPPPAYLPSLISTLPSQTKPVVVILDAFDEFTLHGRQALLYCLLDTVQSCRVGSGLNGLAVIGVTNRVDSIDLLEKRVKSRFSGRMLRTAGPRSVRDWWNLTSAILTAPLGKDDDIGGWKELWSGSVNGFLEERSVKTALHETWALVKDVRMLTRILTTPVLMLSLASPFLTPASLLNSIAEQRCPVGNSFLPSLPYPAICLLIASVHTQTAGHDTFTFEMLHQLFRDQVRISIAAPVRIEGGGSIGMVKCGRQVMMGAFEHLVSTRVFVGVTAASSMVAKEFAKYRSSVEREVVKRTVEKLGTMSLKKWLGKSQQVHN